MKTIVYIDGDQGTTGLQIVSRLEGREDIALRTLPAALRKDPAARAEALDGCDVAILCLPDAAAREAVGMVRNRRVRIIDASSAHRIDPGWTYGFAEMAAGQDERIRTSRRVSNPGCYPTGAVALLRPLIAAGLLPADHPVAIHAVSGYSGKGRAGVDAYEGPDRGAAPAFQVYGLDLDHKHVPEIRAHAGLTEAPIFVPAYGAFRQGIVLTIPLHLRLLPDGSDARRLRDCLADHYARRRRVSVAGGDDTPTPAHLDPCARVGSDDLSLAVHGDAGRSRVLLSAVFDNLGKGAAGAALQNLDLMLGR